ncbi:MAG: regulatory protein RecX [Eubacteriales bacterium]|nr:regulatory protein RecX [Eubacteriales bacterium]
MNIKKECREAALRYLEHRERSAYEITSHLTSKGFSKQEIDEELMYLKELHYVDDERYCESHIRYAMRKGRGALRIRYELKEKGVDEALIQQTLRQYFNRQTEKEIALAEATKILERNFGVSAEFENEILIDEKIIAKIGRRLASLGYESNVIYDIIGQLRR